MSTTFSANFGSLESLKGRDRCGLRPCSFQTRCTVVWPTPISSANIRALQCVACLGFSLAVRVTIASRTSALLLSPPRRISGRPLWSVLLTWSLLPTRTPVRSLLSETNAAQAALRHAVPGSLSSRAPLAAPSSPPAYEERQRTAPARRGLNQSD